MTKKYASPLAEAQGKLSVARSAALAAKVKLNVTRATKLVAENSYEQWREQWPGIDALEGRPTYRGPDGLAVSVDGSPCMIEGHQANNADIYKPPPPSDETLAALEEQLTRAESKEKKEAAALKAEIKARGEWVPPTDTGWIVLKPRRIAGIAYAVGDAFDPTTVEPRKVEQFKSVGLIGHG